MYEAPIVAYLKGKPKRGTVNQSDTEAPDVTCSAIALIFNPLWCLIHDSSGRTFSFTGLSFERARHAKVSNLDIATMIEQNVSRFDVTVHDAFCVEVRKPANHLCNYATKSALGEWSLLALPHSADGVP
jgi:hypothetical protein